MHVIFATYVQNVTTSPCQMANNDKVIKQYISVLQNCIMSYACVQNS